MDIIIRFISTRKQYDKDEDVYIMDAKSIGNIGRYLNHSCNPNVFVQNVFVDTHDLRFPWIAFFTSTFVRAGGELCWDYNYEVMKTFTIYIFSYNMILPNKICE